jgi:hypothetical protein
MQIADEWGPWVVCHPGNALPFQAGDHVRIRTFINQAPYRSADGFIDAAVISQWVFTMTTLRPGLDWIEASVRRPRGMLILIDVLENLPVKVVHE